jgi:hypothetical protein
VYSGDVLGVHFDTKEDRYGYVAALKMAVQNCGYVPYEIVTDRFPGYNTSEWESVKSRLLEFGTKVRETSKATGKAQLERWWETLQSVFMMESKYFYGEGIMSSRPYAHRSVEYLDKIRKEARKEGWDFDAASKSAMDTVQGFRQTPYSQYSKKFREITESPAEMHDNSEKPHTAAVEPWEILSIFDTGRVITLRANMIKMTVLKHDYIYWVDERISLQHFKMMVFYDLEDMDTVYCWNETGSTFLCEGTRQEKVAIYGPNADNKALGKATKRIKDMDTVRKARFTELTAAADSDEDGDESEVDILTMRTKTKAEQERVESKYLTHLPVGRLQGLPEVEEEEEMELVFDARELSRKRL